MKVAFFSDIHANLPALESFFNDLEVTKPDAVYCLGDLVGYNVWPNEVVNAIRDKRIQTIMGNHDEATGRVLAKDNSSSNGAITQQLLTEDNIQYLTSLPRDLKLRFRLTDGTLNVLLVHGSVRAIDDYLTVDYPEMEVQAMLDEEAADVILCGHTHKPYHRILNSEGRPKHVINIGSVGKPKDGDARLCYVLLHIDTDRLISDQNAVHVEFRRVTYDVEKAADAVENSAFDADLARRLREGV